MTQLIREAMENNQPIKLFRSTNNDGSTIQLTHDKKWIKAVKDTDTNKEYHFDMINGKFLVHYSNNRQDKYVKTSSITQWWNKSTIITYDYKFAKLILFNTRQRDFRQYTNPARFIAGLSNPSCARFEQWEAIGVKIVELEDILNELNKGKIMERGNYYRNMTNQKIYKAPNEIEKDLLNVIRNYNTPLTISQINNFCAHSYSFKQHQMLQQLIDYEKQDEYSDLFLVRKNSYSRRFEYESMISTDEHQWDRNRLLETLESYNIDIDRFIYYLRQLKDFEHTDIEWICDNYNDFLRAEYTLRGRKYSKMEKYPSNLVQTHHNRTSVIKDIERERQRLKNEEQRQRDIQIYQSYQHLSYKPRNSKYCIVVPENADDIVDEGVKMNHCVGGYIGRISKEETFIVFMRIQEYDDIPFITVEIRDGILCTALGKNNRRLDTEEKEFLQEFAKKRNLKYNAYQLV